MASAITGNLFTQVVIEFGITLCLMNRWPAKYCQESDQVDMEWQKWIITFFFICDAKMYASYKFNNKSQENDSVG
jgi:hypothetical protein